MNQKVPVPASVIFASLVVFGFLASLSVYMYLQKTPAEKVSTDTSYSGETNLVNTNSELNKKITDNTVPAEPRGRLQYPANTYTIKTGDSLFSLGSKLGLPWLLIKEANGLTADSVQIGQSLAIPVIDSKTDYYRLVFVIDEAVATAKNLELRNSQNDPTFNAVNQAKSYAVNYFGINETDQFDLLSQDLSKGVAVVRVKKNETLEYYIGMIQPKIIGESGFWAMSYIEKRDG